MYFVKTDGPQTSTFAIIYRLTINVIHIAMISLCCKSATLRGGPRPKFFLKKTASRVNVSILCCLSETTASCPRYYPDSRQFLRYSHYSDISTIVLLNSFFLKVIWLRVNKKLLVIIFAIRIVIYHRKTKILYVCNSTIRLSQTKH